VGLHLAVIGGLLVLSVLAWWQVWLTGHPSSAITCSCGDPALETWWIEWLPWAIIHGHNPFFTSALYAGNGGVNAVANGSALFPALVVSPVTVLFGPVAGFNVAETLAPVVSGWCMFLFARKVTSFVPAQLAAALLWGFSPFVYDNIGLGHIHLVLGFFPPLAALVVYDLVVGHRRSPRTNGALLGGLVVLQFFTGTEMLALSVLAGAVGVVVGVAFAPRALWAQRRDLAVAGGATVVVAGALLAYPAWFAAFGPRHVTGKPWPQRDVLSASLGSIVNAGGHIHAPFATGVIAGYGGPRGPAILFLGWGLLAFVAVSAVVWWRRPLAWCALATGAWAWVLSRGSDVHGWWPWHLFARVPLISAAWPVRLADFVDLSAAVLLAISLDGWWRWAQASPARPPGHAAGAPRRRYDTSFGFVVVLLALVGTVAALVPIATSYTFPFTVQAGGLHIPPWFTHEATHLPAGTHVLTIPYSPVALDSNAMVWQAEESLPFDLAGGYALVPDAHGASAWVHPSQGAPLILQALTLGPYFGAREPPLTPKAVSEVRATLTRWGIGVTVVDQTNNLTYTLHYLTAVYGRPPRRERGASVWYGPVSTVGASPSAGTP
jgi:hypothetical protein